MPAYNFQKTFADLVASGAKTQTIRAVGKRKHAEPGDRLQLYTGMRSKACRKLLDPDPVCTAVHGVSIERVNPKKVRLVVTGQGLFESGGLKIVEMAYADGFKSVPELIAYLEQQYGLPFDGVLIEWSPAPGARPGAGLDGDKEHEG